ncbi:hypothetical protein ACFVXQ_31005 [Kitasatospora sp. NPDC058263]
MLRRTVRRLFAEGIAMRLRHSVIAGAGALLMVLAAPSSAFGASGDFTYRGPLGALHTISDPLNGECINLPEATDLLTAGSPANHTNASAVVYTDFDCEGSYNVLPPGVKRGALVRFRSVVFPD